MNKNETSSAIERTIEEARIYQEQNPDDWVGLRMMNEHRSLLENYRPLHGNLFEEFLIDIGTTIGYAIPLIGISLLFDYCSK